MDPIHLGIPHKMIILGKNCAFHMFNGESSSESSEGEAEVTIEVKGVTFIANGVDTDIAFAAAKAFLAACNQAHEILEIVPQI
jgi:hypothetical protein